MLRSLQLLRHEGLLEFRRGRGITVAGTPERGVGVMKARELVELGRKYGYRLDELVEIIEDLACPTSCRSRDIPAHWGRRALPVSRRLLRHGSLYLSLDPRLPGQPPLG